ncbi:MAG: hypothetical protein Q8L08_09745 [Candidatus Nanopelagicaceae bacterium]|nr:hypothetical protein [Candidatus Nanopelagicaceae bacterium]
MLVRRAALVLRIAATFSFFAAAALIIRPASVAEIFGYPLTALTNELLWTLRLMGATFLIPALLAPLVAAFAGERGLRQAAAGMAFISIGLGSLILLTPGRWSLGKLSLALISYFFALLYFYALRGRGRNR